MKRGTSAIVLILSVFILLIVLIISVRFLQKNIVPAGHTLAASYPYPLPDNTYNIGVLVIKFFPLTSDNQNIDIKVTGDWGENFAKTKQHTLDVSDNLVLDLQKASTYLGYTNQSSVPSLNYKIVDTKEYDQAVPLLTDDTRRPNYDKILTENNICDYVENKNISEVWLWAYQGGLYPGSKYPYLNISESKMAGPHGDISNSWRTNDMPTCKKTYRVYTFNYQRGTSEAMESWGHQMEAELSAIDGHLFRDLFQGPNYPQTLKVNGRCGSVHNPPNARNEYDRGNVNFQKSDCLDWKPDGIGQLSDIGCQNWGCQDQGENNNSTLNYMIWNWQNLPGLNNQKTYQDKRIGNLWSIHGDFDNMISQKPPINSQNTISLNPEECSLNKSQVNLEGTFTINIKNYYKRSQDQDIIMIKHIYTKAIENKIKVGSIDAQSQNITLNKEITVGEYTVQFYDYQHFQTVICNPFLKVVNNFVNSQSAPAQSPSPTPTTNPSPSINDRSQDNTQNSLTVLDKIIISVLNLIQSLF